VFFCFFSPFGLLALLRVPCPVYRLSWSVVQEDAYDNKVYRGEKQTQTNRQTSRGEGKPIGKKG
jgi:hypothetical protein